MKVEIHANTLIQITSNLLPSVATNGVLDTLESFRLTATPVGLNIAATNLETAIYADTTHCNVQRSGTVCIPAKLFTESVRALKGQDITIEADAGYKVTITSDSGRYKIAGLSDEGFPAPMPIAPDAPQITMPAADLLHAITKTLPFTSNYELRPQMCGIYFDGKEAAATDAAKLFHLPMPFDTTPFIMPKRVAHLLKSILPQSQSVTFTQSDRGLFFQCGSYLIQGVKIDQNYPNYRAVIPTDTPNELTVSKADILTSLKRISLYADLNPGAVQLACNQNQLTLRTSDSDFSREATEVLDCTYQSEPASIAFNAKMLTAVISNFDGDVITINFSTPTKAALVSDGSELNGLIMPVMID